MSDEIASVGDGQYGPRKVSLGIALPIFWRRQGRVIVYAAEGMYKLGHASEVASDAITTFFKVAELARREHAQFDG